MNIVVNLNDGKTINPIFEPTERNLVEVKKFYTYQHEVKSIKGFVIRYDNGEVFSMGQVL
jgi:hypothetical protein